MSDIDQHRASVATMEAQGLTLLASLVGFMHPIIEAATRRSYSDSEKFSPHHGTTAADLCNSIQAREVLESLGKFIGWITKAQDDVRMPHDTSVDEDRLTENVSCNDSVSSATSYVEEKDIPLDASQISIPKPLSAHELPSAIREKVFEHVFNEMPIRILAFDSSGTQIEMLERSAMTNRIISRIQNTYPNGGWGPDIYETVKQFSQYAILSHTWIRDIPGDVVYQDWDTRELPSRSRGYSKITNFCRIAAYEHGMSFGWMDTVCINKASSTELDESIRSMFKWYRGAHVCVAYLSETTKIEDMRHDSWFTRGWTLQELLAPSVVSFYNMDWGLLFPHDTTADLTFDDPEFNKYSRESNRYASRVPLQLQYQIYKATSITSHELTMFHHGPDWVPLSRIMQLAARRKVTREEDSIYSLIGLLGVGIPVAYGEGSGNALRRFIREIMVSRPRFMDLFHHNNRVSIIPRHISDYTNRSSVFDKDLASRLNDFPQLEPVVLTHMGVRLTLVAVPAFRRDVYEHRIPSGLKSHIFNLSSRFSINQESHDYILLDDSDLSADWTADLITPDDNGLYDNQSLPPTIYMAILSSRANPTIGEYAVSADNALCVALSPGRVGGKKLAEMKHHFQISGPMTIPLPYTSPFDNNRKLRFSPEKASRLGFQVLTQYFY